MPVDGAETRVAIDTLQLDGFLSFAPDAPTIELAPLNVLIGANGAGKSNLLEAFAVLRATTEVPPGDIATVVGAGGGVDEWLWRGVASEGSPPATEARVSAVLRNAAGQLDANRRLRYSVGFASTGHRFHLTGEGLAYTEPYGESAPRVFCHTENGQPRLLAREPSGGRELRSPRLDLSRTVLAQRADAETYPELHALNGLFRAIRLYRDWSFGARMPAREPLHPQTPGDVLYDNARNLAAVLSEMTRSSKLKDKLAEYLANAYARAVEVEVLLVGGHLLTGVRERTFDAPIPASRLSDGTLRWLALLAILLHPSPPPLVCIEEPELGLHPDLIHVLADLLLDASQRTQLVVTTHSSTLVDALTDHPECVLVCDYDERCGTSFTRLDGAELKTWLDEYSLGNLWRSGQLGGTRW